MWRRSWIVLIIIVFGLAACSSPPADLPPSAVAVLPAIPTQIEALPTVITPTNAPTTTTEPSTPVPTTATPTPIDARSITIEHLTCLAQNSNQPCVDYQSPIAGQFAYISADCTLNVLDLATGAGWRSATPPQSKPYPYGHPRCPLRDGWSLQRNLLAVYIGYLAENHTYFVYQADGSAVKLVRSPDWLRWNDQEQLVVDHSDRHVFARNGQEAWMDRANNYATLIVQNSASLTTTYLLNESGERLFLLDYVADDSLLLAASAMVHRAICNMAYFSTLLIRKLVFAVKQIFALTPIPRYWRSIRCGMRLWRWLHHRAIQPNADWFCLMCVMRPINVLLLVGS